METVYSCYSTVYNIIWDERVWFPPGVNWTTFRSVGDHEQFPDFSEMYYPIAYAFIILAIRTIFEWSVARPLGKFFGIEDVSSELENFFLKVYHKVMALKKFLVRVMSALVSNGDLSYETNGFLQPDSITESKSGTKRLLVVPKSTLDKFSESCWRFVYYLFMFIYGLVVLWNKPWLWDTAHCWYGYPFQTIPSEIRWYYMIEASFYWSLMFSQFTDVHRKDFTMNFIHHFATIALLWFSWADNFVRIGSLVLVCHDAVDIWMEAGKMALYCKYEKLYDVILTIFSIVWLLTRLTYYPFQLIYSSMVEAPALVGFYGAYYIFSSLLLVIQILHILWSIMIIRIILNAKRGQPSDVRSDDEEEDDDD